MSNVILNPLNELPLNEPFPKPSAMFSSWDVMINGKSYIVGEFEDHPHTIRYMGGSEAVCDLYCWPRDEEPTRENVVQYIMPDNGPVDWGILYEHYNKIKYKYGESEIQPIGMITITRNGKKFYSFRGSMNIGIDKARCIIESLQDYPINFNAYDYINKEILGLECYFYGYKAKIDYWCDGQGCACLICAEEDPERRKAALAKWEAVGCEDSKPKIDIVDPYPGTGFTWYDPESE